MEDEIIRILLRIFRVKIRVKNRELIAKSVDCEIYLHSPDEEEILLHALIGEFLTEFKGGMNMLAAFYQKGPEEFSRYVGQAAENFLSKKIRELKGRMSGESEGRENEGRFLYRKLIGVLKAMGEDQQVLMSKEKVSESLITLPDFRESPVADWGLLMDRSIGIDVVERAFYINAGKKRDPVIRNTDLRALVLEILEISQMQIPFALIWKMVKKKISWDNTSVVFFEDLAKGSDEEVINSGGDSQQAVIYQQAESAAAWMFEEVSLEMKQAFEQVQSDLLAWTEADQMLLVMFFLFGISPAALSRQTSRFGKQTFLYNKKITLLESFCGVFGEKCPDGTDVYKEVKNALNVLTDWVFETVLSKESRNTIEKIIGKIA